MRKLLTSMEACSIRGARTITIENLQCLLPLRQRRHSAKLLITIHSDSSISTTAKWSSSAQDSYVTGDWCFSGVPWCLIHVYPGVSSLGRHCRLHSGWFHFSWYSLSYSGLGFHADYFLEPAFPSQVPSSYLDSMSRTDQSCSVLPLLIPWAVFLLSSSFWATRS